MASTHETVAVLRELIATCREGSEGYRDAASEISDARLRSTFERYAEQRALFLSELEGEVRRLGEDPRDMPTLSDALHRSWKGIREALTASDTASIIEECERSEDATMTAYRQALDAPLPDPIHDMVERQYESVRQAHEEIRGYSSTNPSSQQR